MITFNNKPVEVITPEYSSAEEFKEKLLNTGYLFLKDVIDLNFNSSEYVKDREDVNKENIKYRENFYYPSSNYEYVLSKIKTSKLLKALKNSFSNLYIANHLVFRYMKNNEGTYLHKDEDLIHDLPFFTVWVPLQEVALENGPVAMYKFSEKSKEKLLDKKLSLIQSKITKKNIAKYLEKNYDTHENIKYEFNHDLDSLITRNLNPGDAVVFLKNFLHCSLDVHGVRSSFDFRIVYSDKLIDNNMLLNLNG